jgi:hypothetical protein
MASTPITAQLSGDFFKNLYILSYRKDINVLRYKYFYQEGGYQEARKRAEDHCKIMQYKLASVQVFLSDLSKDESTYKHEYQDQILTR